MLHHVLGSLIPELTWLETHRDQHVIQGISWPPDFGGRIERIASEFQAWEPSAPVPPGLLASWIEFLRRLVEPVARETPTK